MGVRASTIQGCSGAEAHALRCSVGNRTAAVSRNRQGLCLFDTLVFPSYRFASQCRSLSIRSGKRPPQVAEPPFNCARPLLYFTRSVNCSWTEVSLHDDIVSFQTLACSASFSSLRIPHF